MKKNMDLFTDCLLNSFGQVAVTGLSDLLDGSMYNDNIIRMLSGVYYIKNIKLLNVNYLKN